MITYNEYPLLLFTSFDKDNAEDELPFKVQEESIIKYLSGSRGFNEMLALIGVKNTIMKGNSNTNYYLEDNLFERVDNDSDFRNRNFASFFSQKPKPENGVIMFKGRGQYVYLLLSETETRQMKEKKGMYFAVALFKNDFFIGFEEGYIQARGIEVENSGYYASGMDKGGYISFVIVTLSYAAGKELPILTAPGVKERIYELK